MFLFFIWLVFLLFYQKVTFIILVLSSISFLFFYFYIPSVSNINKDAQTIPNTVTTLSGKITHFPILSDKKLELILYDENLKSKISVVHFWDEHTPYDDAILNKLEYGATCLVSGKMSNIERATNPFQFDYRDYLLKKGIMAQFIVDSLQEIKCKSNISIYTYVNKLRNSLMTTSNQKLTPEIAAWQQALVLGNRDDLDESVITLFQKWGLSHLLAISGLHVGIIMALIYFLLIRLSPFSKEKIHWFILFFLLFYALLAGGQPSVWRASLMGIFGILLHKGKVKLGLTDLLSIVFLVLIITNKYIIYHIGFQFSFLVTLGIVLSAQWISSSHTNIGRLLQISFVAQMMIVPLQMIYFYHFQPLSILVNVIIVPYFSLIVIPAMFLSFLLTIFPDFLIWPFENIFLAVHHLMMNFVQWLDQHVSYPFITGDISMGITIIYYFLFFCMMMQLEKGNKNKSFQFGIAISLLLTFVIIKPYISPVGSVTMLDIGQGDAIIIELPYRKGVFMVDAGAMFHFNDMEPSDSVYKQIIKPYLMGRGIHNISAIFLSHNHTDHDGSIQYIVDDYSVDEIITHDYYNKDNLLKNTGRNVKHTFVHYNEKLNRNGQQFYVLSPQKDYGDENDNSLVLLTKLGGHTWLFTGDISKNVEKEIVRKYSGIKADVLKVAHHGSKTSTDIEFIQEIRPKIALISAGRNNRYGHPSKETIETLEQTGINIFQTAEVGAVQFRYRGQTGNILLSN